MTVPGMPTAHSSRAGCSFSKTGYSTRAGAASGSDPCAFAGHVLLHAIHADRDAADAQIADKAVRAAADDGDRDSFFMRLFRTAINSSSVVGMTNASAGPPMPYVVWRLIGSLSFTCLSFRIPSKNFA